MCIRPQYRLAEFWPLPFWIRIFVTVAILCLQLMPLRAEVSMLDCAAIAHVLSLDEQISDMDLDARDAMARRIERHGETLGLSPTQIRLSALALRDNDTDLADLILSDSDPLQQAYGACLESAGISDADIGLTAKTAAQNAARQDSVRFPSIKVWAVQASGSWMVFAVFSGGLLLIGGIVWLAGRADRRNRRRLRRYNCDIPAVLRQDSGPELPVRITDINAEGCRLSLGATGVKVGAQSLLALGRTTIEAKVVWCNKHFCGVQFASKLPEGDVIAFLKQDQAPIPAPVPG